MTPLQQAEAIVSLRNRLASMEADDEDVAAYHKLEIRLMGSEKDLKIAIDNQHKYMEQNIALESKLNKATDALRRIDGMATGTRLATVQVVALNALEDIGQ